MPHLKGTITLMFVLLSCSTQEKNSTEFSHIKNAEGHYTEWDHRLPWDKSTSRRVTSFPGNYSHIGKQKFSWDFSMNVGTEVLATVNGYIRKIQYSSNAPQNGGSAQADKGNYVILYWADGSGRESQYLHLSKVSVSQGQYVKQGEVIGLSGCTGYCNGPHLHYQVQTGARSKDDTEASYFLQSVNFNFRESLALERGTASSQNTVVREGTQTPQDIGDESEDTTAHDEDTNSEDSDMVELSNAVNRCKCISPNNCPLSEIAGGPRTNTLFYNAPVNVLQKIEVSQGVFYKVETSLPGRYRWIDVSLCK